MDPIFVKTIDLMAEHAAAMQAALTNQQQPTWLALADSYATREALFTKLDRKGLNQEFAKLLGDTEKPLSEVMAVELQHDFLAALARDHFALRAPRLFRIGCGAAKAMGKAGDSGVLKNVLLQYIKTLLTKKR